MKEKIFRLKVFILLTAGILAVFVVRTILASHDGAPRLFELFDVMTVAGSVVILVRERSIIKPIGWLLAAVSGCVIFVGMYFSSLFSPYPFFGVVHSNLGQALVRGVFTFLAAGGGLAIMYQGGPVLLQAVTNGVGRAGREFTFGVLVGIPLAVLNVFALQLSEARSISWQNPLAALLDALQPAVVEEVIYRFALWGLLWMILRSSLPDEAVWLSGMLAMLIHNYAHFDALFVQSPLSAMGMGLVVMIFWGLPPTLLARYRDLEAAISFHWIQDVARFLAGF